MQHRLCSCSFLRQSNQGGGCGLQTRTVKVPVAVLLEESLAVQVTCENDWRGSKVRGALMSISLRQA
jgi:hypothetical protein